ncbi:MAG: AI-2E family transporter, partial [Candidatus Wallbacteria bacterium]|nr:AI-2E family transporter [Candidatus Wallbacteria bacterium]
PVANKMAGGFLRYAVNFFGNTLGLAVNIFIMLLAFYFMLRKGKELGRFFIRLSPLHTKDEMALYDMFRGIGRGVILGNTVAAIVQGTLAGLGLFLFSVPKPVFLGVLATFFSFIPFVGPLVVCLPSAAWLLIDGHRVSGVLLALYSVLLVSSADNVVKPYFISGQASVHPFLVLLSIIGGLSLFGVMGIFYGPLIVTVFLTLAGIYLKETETEAREEG